MCGTLGPACVAVLLCASVGASEGPRRVRVGVYQNEPKIFLDSSGRASGFHIEILEEIARREGWELEYVYGTWAECLKRLEAGEIDLLPDVAYSEDRARRFDFNREVVLRNWARLYAHTGVAINDIFDLRGRTVAVVAGDISYEELRKELERFGVECGFLEVSGFKEVFESIDRRRAEAGLISRVFGEVNEARYNVKRTFMVVCPAALHFATPKCAGAELLAAIDRCLSQLKGDEKSIYYRALSKWIASAERRGLPTWLVPVVGGLVAVTLLLAAFGALLRHQVKLRTASLEQAKAELENYKDHLESLVAERTRELEAVNKELEAFSYSVSHDLRAPLRAMDGFSRAVLEDYTDKLDEEGKDYLQRIRAAAQRMGALIDDLLKLSRVTRADLKKGPTDLSALASDCIAALREAEPHRKVEVVITPGLIVEADSQLMRAAIDNLLRNAWKFTRKTANARIEFGSLDGPDGKTYYVRDNGVGFDPTYADKLFGPFQRLHSSEEFEGSGIGLATVARIIHKHGGRVWAEGKPGAGATFYFTL